jgi:ABC-type phosphate transport system substrate-binding protein
MKRQSAALVLACTLAGSVHAEVVVVVNPKSHITSLSREQVAQIYLGRAETLTPVDRLDDPALRGAFYTGIVGKSLGQVKSIWSKLIFTGRATPPLEVYGMNTVRKAVAGNVNAIGYLDAADVDASVRTITIQP